MPAAKLTDRMAGMVFRKTIGSSLADFTVGGIVNSHFAYYRDPIPGDLVYGQTGRDPQWKICWYVEKLYGAGGWDGAVVREIGSQALCNYHNETFIPIVGLYPLDLLEGDRRLMYQKVLGAFRKGDEYFYRFGGLEFKGDTVVITVREAFGGFVKPSIPFDVTMPWSKRTTVKAILQAMREQGYGTKSFRPDEPVISEAK